MAISKIMGTKPRIAWLLVSVLALGCGGKAAPKQSGPELPAAAREYPALRYVPSRPTYAIAAKTVRAAQRGLADLADSFGLVLDIDRGRLGGELRALFGVDPFSPEELAAVGIDLEGSATVFSEATDPTFVVHLAAPTETAAFLDKQRARAGQTQSVMVDGHEIFSAEVVGAVGVSWTIADDWLWVHFTFGTKRDDTSWFTASKRPGAPAWTTSWDWARAIATSPSVVGFLDPKALLGKLATKVTSARACVQLLEPVERVAVALSASSEGNGGASGKFAFELGASSQVIARAVLPPPDGWVAASERAPLAAQWNLDLPVVATALGPCAKLFDVDLASFTGYGARTARVILRSFDPSGPSGTGALALDLANKRYFASRLDDIPLRSRFEDKKQFGPYAGRHLSIPMVPDVDYVLTDSIALAAIGDGILARLVGTGKPGAAAPIVAVDVLPAGLSTAAWTSLFELADIPGARRIPEALSHWRDIHLGATLEGTRLVVEASGNRR
ncbi:MAG TPA: hypothetical protein VIU61_23025 [Kofleriaceae bacterium]